MEFLIQFLWEYLILDEGTVHNSQKSTRPTTTVRTRQGSSVLTVSSRRKRDQQNENLEIAITELLNHFSHRNLDAIIRVIRITLEKLRKRITSSHTYSRQNILLKILYFKFLFSTKSS